MSVEYPTPDEADYRARVFVNGLVEEIIQGESTGKKVPNSAHWSPFFSSHPWVIAAENEGWGRELRSVVISFVAGRIIRRMPHFEISELMPDQKWVQHARNNAQRYKDAQKWRDGVIEKHGSLEAFLTRTKKSDTTARPLGSITIPGLEEMQHASRNSMHRDRP